MYIVLYLVPTDHVYHHYKDRVNWASFMYPEDLDIVSVKHRNIVRKAPKNAICEILLFYVYK